VLGAVLDALRGASADVEEARAGRRRQRVLMLMTPVGALAGVSAANVAPIVTKRSAAMKKEGLSHGVFSFRSVCWLLVLSWIDGW
jgi:hypothetical protein